ncbi:helix-turn-helix domain-containing protein [Lachnospiraceae bacterium]|nr:helix-turn-helix domain-containing protein [Lachnospiraceae bacterium]
MTYESITQKKKLDIDEIVFLHHFELINGISFHEESHDCWEFLYVVKGTVNVVSGQVLHTLHKDDILFHPPGEPHRIQANGMAVPSLFVVGFQSVSPAMDFLWHKKIEVAPQERTLISHLIEEIQLTYSIPLEHPSYRELVRRSDDSIPFGSEQMILLYLQQLLIQLIRYNNTDTIFAPVSGFSRRPGEEELFYKVIAYMEEHLREHLSISQICKDNLIGRSLLQQLFRDYTGCGIIDYFSLMKINAAKQLILQRQLNFSQIADYLGYNSIHYFSRQFKKLTGITPSEYAASLPPI